MKNLLKLLVVLGLTATTLSAATAPSKTQEIPSECTEPVMVNYLCLEYPENFDPDAVGVCHNNLSLRAKVPLQKNSYGPQVCGTVTDPNTKDTVITANYLIAECKKAYGNEKITAVSLTPGTVYVLGCSLACFGGDSGNNCWYSSNSWQGSDDNKKSTHK